MSHLSHRTVWRGSPKGGCGLKDYCAKYRWVTRRSQSRRIYEWVIYMNESCHQRNYMHEVGVDGKILAPNIVEGAAYTNESCHIYELVMFHTGLFARGGGWCKDSRAKYCWGWWVHPFEDRSLGMNPSSSYQQRSLIPFVRRDLNKYVLHEQYIPIEDRSLGTNHSYQK